MNSINDTYAMNNCIFDLLNMWLENKDFEPISDYFLFLACCNIEFKYSSTQGTSEIIPSFNLEQDTHLNMLSSFNIEINEKYSYNSDEAWKEIESLLLNMEVPIIQGDVSKLPNLEKTKTVTFFAINDYNKEKQTVNLTSLYYHGEVSLKLLESMRYHIKSYGYPPNRWLEFDVKELPQFTVEYLVELLVSNFYDGIVENSKKNILMFINDIKKIDGINIALYKIVMNSIAEQLYHPLGPPSTRKQLLVVLKQLYSKKLVRIKTIKSCETLLNQWDKVKLIIAKESLKKSGDFQKRIEERLNNIMLFETKTMTLIKKDMEELGYDL